MLPPTPSAVRPTAAQWRIIFLLVISVAINYIDRGSLSIAAPALRSELSLPPDRLGVLLSAFFWSYAGFMVVAGWLADRFSTGVVLGVGYLIWSLATLGTGFVAGFQALLILRVVLGLGESVSYPVYSRIIAGQFPINQRGLPNAMIDAGAKVGPAVGNLVGGLLVASYGWRVMFLILGMGGLLWLLPWYVWAPRNRGAAEPGADQGPSTLQICAKRDAWGTFIGNFCCNYPYYFLLTWLPSYLVSSRGLSMKMMAVLASLPFAASASASLFGGWASDRWITRGASPTKVRKTFVVGGMVLATLMFPAALAPDLRVSMVLLVATYVGLGLFSSNHWAITQTLAGPLAAGRWTGLQNGIANLAGVIAPVVTGLIVSRTGSYTLAFSSASVIVLIGAFSYMFVVRDVAPVKWQDSRDSA
ncbi:MAG: MFS transporter [Candidatus Solibacter usitatus]|nr:MFS transporter [Candidatus Solibacter usitatus]